MTLAVACVAAIAIKALGDYRWEREKAKFIAAQAPLQQAYNAFQAKVQRVSNSKQRTLEDWEAALGVALSLQPDGEKQSSRYVDPVSGSRLEINFDPHGRYRGYSLHSGPPLVGVPQPQRLSIELAAANIARSTLPTPAFLLWISILIWSVLDRSRRWFSDRLLMTWAVGCSLIWFSNPLYPLESAFSSDPMFAGALMLFGSGVALIAHRPRRMVDHLSCRNCDYNLTGNVSGICPECGTETPGMLAGRELT